MHTYVSARTQVILLLALAACHRGDAAQAADSSSPTSPSPSGSPSASGGPSPTASPSPAPPSDPKAYAPPGESERRVVTDPTKDSWLAAYAKQVRAHFAEDTRTPFVVQRAGLSNGSAFFVRQGELMPMLIVEDRDHKLLWIRERPTNGMLPPVRDPVIVGRRGGGVAMFAYDVPAHVLAGRLIDDDGSPFADLSMMNVDDCGAVSAATWPRHGIVVVCARADGPRLQIVRESSVLALSREGVRIGEKFRVAAPVSIAIDAEDSFMVAQYVTDHGADHVWVTRFDAAGNAIWAEPRDLGEVPVRDAEKIERIKMEPLAEGIRFTLAQGKKTIEVDSQGTVRTR